MYVYDEHDRQMAAERVAQFRDQTERALAGELAEDEFLPLRLQNGLYVQRLAPMLRICVPYGMMRSDQLRRLARITRDYDKGYAHFTTRQNVQLNWPALEDVPDILAELAEVEITMLSFYFELHEDALHPSSGKFNQLFHKRILRIKCR